MSQRLKSGETLRTRFGCIPLRWSWHPSRCLPRLRDSSTFFAMSKAEILEALPKLSPEERQEIRAKLNELDGEEWL